MPGVKTARLNQPNNPGTSPRYNKLNTVPIAGTAAMNAAVAAEPTWRTA